MQNTKNKCIILNSELFTNQKYKVPHQLQNKNNQKMSSPKILQTNKSPRNNSTKQKYQKQISKRSEKSKQPIQGYKKREDVQYKYKDKEKEKDKDKYEYEQLINRCNHLENELSKERAKNQILEKQLRCVIQELKCVKLQRTERAQFRQKHSQSDKAEGSIKVVSFCIDDKKYNTNNTNRKQKQSTDTVSAFQPESPKQKVQVGGYFGSLFN